MQCIFSSEMEAGGQHPPLYLFKNDFLRNQCPLKYGGDIRVLAPLGSMCQMITVVSLLMSILLFIKPAENAQHCPPSPY